MRRFCVLSGLLAIHSVIACSPAFAQDFPHKPITIEDARKAEQDIRVIPGDEYNRALQEQQTQFQALWKTSPWNR